jgi:Zn-dependent peptidase ImmA (M78 family)
VLEQEQVRKEPVNIDRIAKKHAEIRRRPLGKDISGMLIPTEDSWVIVVNDEHPEVRQRFTLAHELAHILLHGYKVPHADRGFRLRYPDAAEPTPGTDKKVRYRNATSAQGSEVEEIEANQFAAALLMPRDLLLRKLQEVGFEYEASVYDEDEETDDAPHLREIADAFRVSRQALSLRLGALGAG